MPSQPVPLEAANGQQFMVHAVLPNSLEDVMNAIYCEHTREMRARKRRIYGQAGTETSSKTNELVNTNSLFELKDEETELAVSTAAATAAVIATEKALRRMCDLQDATLYRNRRIPSPSASTTSLCSEDEENECSENDEPMRDLRQALAQVESSLADQARILFTIEQERKKEAAISFVFSAAASS